MKDIPAEVTSVEVLAWIGEDEFGSGVVGMKQIMTPNGISCLAAVTPGHWVQHEHVQMAMQIQSNTYGKTIYLCRYRLESIERIVTPSRLSDEGENNEQKD